MDSGGEGMGRDNRRMGLVRARSALLARNWWMVGLRGVLAVSFGVIALTMPLVALQTLALLFAAYLAVDGVFAIIAGLRAAERHERWAWLVVEGVINIIAGIVASALPDMTIIVFVLIVAAWAVVTGIAMTSSALHLHLSHGSWLLALGGLVSIAWGVVLVLSPIAGAVVLAFWIGAYAVIFGVTLIALSLRLRSRRPHAAPTDHSSGSPSAI